MEVPKMDGVLMENITKMDDLGVITPILGNLHMNSLIKIIRPNKRNTFKR